MQCRVGCGACCITISISSALPEMPNGKPAGVRCPELSNDGLCKLFNSPMRPNVCSEFQAEPMFCGSDNNKAMQLMADIEQLTNERLAH